MKKSKFNSVIYTYTLLVLGFNRDYSDMVVLDEIQGFASEEEALDFYFDNYIFPETARVSFDVIREAHKFKVKCVETERTIE